MDCFPIRLSESILSQAKLGQDSSLFRRELYFMKASKLETCLSNDELKSVFWANIYNTYVLIIAEENEKVASVFKYKRIKIASTAFSLDDIEFKILRRNNQNLLYKAFNSVFSSSFFNNLALETRNYSFDLILDRTTLNR
jgi:hypothetical protein